MRMITFVILRAMKWRKLIPVSRLCRKMLTALPIRAKRGDAMADASDKRELKYNGSGYYDDTAYRAIMNAEKEKNMGTRVNYIEGDIVKIVKQNGSSGMSLLIKCNTDYATTMMLRGEEPAENACKIITADGDEWYSDAGRPGYVYYSNITEVTDSIDDDELEDAKKAIAKAFGIDVPHIVLAETVANPTFTSGVVKKEYDTAAVKSQEHDELIRLVAERDIWKMLYEQERRRGQQGWRTR